MEILESYKKKAFEIDLKKESQNAFELLELRKAKFNNASFKSEIEEVKADSEAAVKSLKEDLQRIFFRENHKATYNNHTPLFLIQIRLYYEYLELYQMTSKAPDQSITQIKEKRREKELEEYFINIDEGEKINFLVELQKSFPTEKGKSIRAIIDILKDKSLLVIGAREFKAFLNKLENRFARDIGTYQSIQNVKHIDIEVKTPIMEKLKPIITQHSNTA